MKTATERGRARRRRSRRRGDRIRGSLAAIAHSRFWHEADMVWRTRDVGFEGVKRTWLIDRLKSAVDPKQTSAPKTPTCYMCCLAAEPIRQNDQVERTAR